MNKSKTLKITNHYTIEGMVDIFENESPNVQIIRRIKKKINLFIIASILYLCFMISIKNNIAFLIISSIVIPSILIGYMYYVIGNLTYTYTEKQGGKKYTPFKNKFKEIMEENLKITEKTEIKIIKKILKVNHLNYLNCMREIRETLRLNIDEKEEIGDKIFTKDILTAYIIPVLFGVINIYTAIANNLDFNEIIIGIIYTALGILLILGVILIIHKIYKIKTFSITTTYTYSKISKILTQLIIEEEIQNNRKT